MNSHIWLAADYHMPLTYSCRMPLSNPFSAQTLVVPGPSTVRLALVRVAVELFGQVRTRESIFSVIGQLDVAIRPPKGIGVTSHILKAYKVDRRHQLVDSIAYREFAHAEGVITVFLKIPTTYRKVITELLYGIGYWGQANSFASCMRVFENEPKFNEIIQPLSAINPRRSLDFLTAFVTEWDESQITWEIITATEESKTPVLRPTLYSFPLRISEQLSTSYRLVCCSLE